MTNDYPALWTVLQRTAAGLSVAIAAGCVTVGPDYEAPETSTPDRWEQAVVGEMSSDEPDIMRWWETLGDPQLTEYMQRAREGNPGLALASRTAAPIAAVPAGRSSRPREIAPRTPISTGQALRGKRTSGAASGGWSSRPMPTSKRPWSHTGTCWCSCIRRWRSLTPTSGQASSGLTTPGATSRRNKTP